MKKLLLISLLITSFLAISQNKEQFPKYVSFSSDSTRYLYIVNKEILSNKISEIYFVEKHNDIIGILYKTNEINDCIFLNNSEDRNNFAMYIKADNNKTYNKIIEVKGDKVYFISKEGKFIPSANIPEKEVSKSRIQKQLDIYQGFWEALLSR